MKTDTKVKFAERSGQVQYTGINVSGLSSLLVWTLWSTHHNHIRCLIWLVMQALLSLLHFWFHLLVILLFYSSVCKDLNQFCQCAATVFLFVTPEPSVWMQLTETIMFASYHSSYSDISCRCCSIEPKPQEAESRCQMKEPIKVSAVIGSINVFVLTWLLCGIRHAGLCSIGCVYWLLRFHGTFYLCVCICSSVHRLSAWLLPLQKS